MSTQSVKINGGDRSFSRKRRHNITVKNSNGKSVLNATADKCKSSDQVSSTDIFRNTFPYLISVFTGSFNENWHAISELIRSLIAFHHTFFSRKRSTLMMRGCWEMKNFMLRN